MTDTIMCEAGKAMDPEFVTPVVVYLSHRNCDRTAHIYSVGAGKVSRVFIGVTKGIENTSLTAESVAEAIDGSMTPRRSRSAVGPPRREGQRPKNRGSRRSANDCRPS